MSYRRAIAGSIDEYLATVPAGPRTLLAQLRAEIHRQVPDVEERIGYGMPAFRWNGPLVYLAAFADHLSFFPGSAATRACFAEELRPYLGGKGTVRFTVEDPIPMPLFRRIVRSRNAENRARASSGTRKRRRAAPGRPRPARSRAGT